MRPVVLGVCPVVLGGALVLGPAMQTRAAAQPSGPGRSPDGAVPVRTCADARVEPEIRAEATRVAATLLLTAEVVVSWLPCLPPSGLPSSSPAVSAILVYFSQAGAENTSGKCGRAAYGSPRGTGIVRVEVGCVATVALALSRQSRDPRLAMPRHADLLGAVVAHEIGHLLGLGHSRQGLMRDRFGVEEVVALRDGRLGFSPQQSAAIRVWLDGEHARAGRR